MSKFGGTKGENFKIDFAKQWVRYLKNVDQEIPSIEWILIVFKNKVKKIWKELIVLFAFSLEEKCPVK